MVTFQLRLEVSREGLRIQLDFDFVRNLSTVSSLRLHHSEIHAPGPKVVGLTPLVPLHLDLVAVWGRHCALQGSLGAQRCPEVEGRPPGRNRTAREEVHDFSLALHNCSTGLRRKALLAIRLYPGVRDAEVSLLRTMTLLQIIRDVKNMVGGNCTLRLFRRLGAVGQQVVELRHQQPEDLRRHTGLEAMRKNIAPGCQDGLGGARQGHAAPPGTFQDAQPQL
mmetsp:Transcript_18024/g.40648  ORF Transcript_18024/g.40648 Transcript_18024/m.40648 type:complete len:222 (-) Transcript_18024:184-849(-)